ncbi:MAG: ATP-binding protein [Terrimicrobiaceae bacterium]|nr:ATP-binding protein [Terrimicrobiaceae bacterium]
MITPAHFSVDPRLATILGENYSSSERALRELIDNSWDAEAKTVRITLPSAMTEEPIVIADDGNGMKEQELRQEYLNIASPRTTRKGDRTPNLNRIVKGRRGVGKFSGLILADEMQVVTQANGVETTIVISKSVLMAAGKDIEQVPLPVSVAACPEENRGTTITLRHLNPNLNFPQADKLREILAYDYGRETGIELFINGEKVARHDIQGETFTKEYTLPNGSKATATYTVSDKPVASRKAGLILRAGDKAIGKPHHWGLEHEEQLTDRLRNRVVGEVKIESEAIELTAAGGDVIESDKGFEYLTKAIQEDVKSSLTQVHTNEVNLAKGRWTQLMKRRLEAVPEHRRDIVEERLEKLISRSYQEGEKEERITVLINLALDALEMDEYWTVCREVEAAEKADVFIFAQALDKFGLTDLAFIGQQAERRRMFLDNLDKLAVDSTTSEAQMHTALQHNLWIFGNEYSLMASNRQLQTIVKDFTDKIYKAKDSTDRPDLLLAANVENRHLLLEFKRPELLVGRAAELQAITYADTLTGQLGISLDILIVGGQVDPKLQAEYSGKRTKFLAYRAVIATARTQLEWLLRQLNEKP